MDALVLLAAAAILVLGFASGWAMLRRWKPSGRRRRTAPPGAVAWQRLIEERVPIVRGLTESEWSRLLDLVGTFVREKNFEGIDGLVVTEEMKVIVAAQASLLIVDLDDAACFPSVRSIILYPGTFVPRVPALSRHGPFGPDYEPGPTLGESLRGAVVLSWDSVTEGVARGDEGRNVVLHEFAHQLDLEDGLVDGVPLLEAPSSTRVWARVFRERFEELRRAAVEGEPDVLSAYGATNRAEFFAVATEAFFGRPVELRSRYPDLYHELKGYYRQDPAERLEAHLSP